MRPAEIKTILAAHLGWLLVRGGERADLSGANLSGANLSAANLRAANLRVAKLSVADLRWTTLRRADLRGADLRRADLRFTDLRRADLRGADLRGADLRDANLRGAYLERANLSGADLRGGRGLPAAPVIPAIDAAILAAVEAGGGLDMSGWHTCGTTHCRAGWAITLAGDAGAELERRLGPSVAGALIYTASRPGRPVPDWHATDEDALADLRRCSGGAL